MRSIFRNEIWTVELKESYKNIIMGVHPVLIISSFKHIIRANTVNVLPITSQNKNQINHVKIDGYGLEKSSVILTEQIITINKSDLITKVGVVDNVKMQEVNNALKKQLQLEQNNLTVEDLKRLFKLQAENIDSVNEFNSIKSLIKDNYSKNEYSECKKLCIELIERVSGTKIDSKKEFLWYGNYALGLMYIKENNITEAFKYSSKSLEYISDLDISQQNYLLSMWALARCYEELDPDEAKEIYRLLVKIYTENNNNKMRLSCQFAVAFLDKNLFEMAKIIEIIKGYESDTWYYGEEKESVLKQMQMQLDVLKSI